MDETKTPFNPAAEVVAEARQLEAEAKALGISVVKLLANRRNAAKSTGPVTEAGKKRSSMNSYRNGLNGQIVCKTAEELEAHQKFVSDMLAELCPMGPSETSCAIAIAENTIRLHKIRAIEDGIYALGFRDLIDSIDTGHPETDAAMAQSQTWLNNAKGFSLLSTYAVRIRRELKEDRAEFRALQAERRARYEEARQHAVELVAHAESKGELYHPGDDFMPPEKHGGFVFSRGSVADFADRQLRFEEAKNFYHRHKNSKLDPASAPPRTKIDRAA